MAFARTRFGHGSIALFRDELGGVRRALVQFQKEVGYGLDVAQEANSFLNQRRDLQHLLGADRDEWE